MSRFGLTQEQVDLVQKLLVEPTWQLGGRVLVFGSRARGSHHQFSDLDVLIEGNVHHDKLSEIQEALEESTLPIKVDIVCEADLAESYRPSIMQDMVQW